MPSDLLLPAFAVTLVLNAAIIALAIRSLRTERSPRPAPTSLPRPIPRAARAPVEVPATEARTTTAQPATPDEPRPPPMIAEPEPPAPVVPSPAASPATADAARGRRTAAGTRTGRRRKFSLPPPEDHEKVSRSIETFLAATDVPATAGDDAALVAPRPVVTVAAIQLVGDAGHEVLERAVRSTARGTDTVTVDRRGRVRVVLAGTGELAAHAYLRRIRAIVQPILESEEPPSRVVIATATELNGAVATARRRADRRLAVAIRSAAAESGAEVHPTDGDELDELDERPLPKPRAAGD